MFRLSPFLLRSERGGGLPEHGQDHIRLHAADGECGWLGWQPKSTRIPMPRLALALLLCMSACLGQGKRAQSPVKPMRLEAFGFSVKPPSGWNAGVDEKGLPIFANFRWSRMGAQFTLPRQGALINVVDWDKLPRRRGDETLLGWASLDAGIAASGSMVSHPLDVPVPTGISEAVLSTFDVATFSPPGPAPARNQRILGFSAQEVFGAPGVCRRRSTSSRL